MATESGAIIIRPFSPEFTAKVIDLIVPIQRQEFGFSITAADQPDLFEIPEFYQKKSGNFWIALAGEEVVGTISLVDLGHQQAALRKMFVHKTVRGNGTAKRLLDTLLQWARVKHLQEIYLGTTDRFLAAHRFYEKNGFEEITPAELPETFLYMPVDTKFYRYVIR